MFKFIQQYTEKMEHVAIYPMISLFIFFLFFVVLLVFVKKMDKSSITELSNLPLDIETTASTL
jgi:cytochrome c oxidase cbb3-type subunit 4